MTRDAIAALCGAFGFRVVCWGWYAHEYHLIAHVEYTGISPGLGAYRYHYLEDMIEHERPAGIAITLDLL